jgi:hypothetical protein
MTTTAPYTASAIRILTADEVADRFSWARVAELAERYRKPAAWIERGLEACRRAGVGDEYFVDRYLKREPIARDDRVDEQMRELLIEARQSKGVQRCF